MWAAAAGLGVLVLCSLVVADGTVPSAERTVFLWINGLPDWLEPPLWIFQQTGNIVVATVVTAALGILLRNYRTVWAAVVAASSKLVLEPVLKSLVERPRPGTSIGAEAVLRGDVHATGLSFVSGHATITTAMAVILTIALPGRWRAVPWAFVVLNGVGRIYVGAHNPLDVVGGIGLGLAIGVGASTLTAPRGRGAGSGSH